MPALTRTGAIRKTIRTLERRWADRLPDGRIPAGMKKVMVKRSEFEEMADRVQATGVLPLPDLDFHPIVSRLPDGTMVDLMMEELGFDPTDFECVDCGDEIQRGKVRCDPCLHWRKTGKTS